MAKQSMRALPQMGKQGVCVCGCYKSDPSKLIYLKSPYIVSYFSTSSMWRATAGGNDSVVEIKEPPKTKTEKFMAFQKKLRAKTPLGKLDEFSRHPYQEKEPLKPWPNSTNPYTGEIGGPAGPEPTRYGDWERKGRVSDF